jgi:hypothetical protein
MPGLYLPVGGASGRLSQHGACADYGTCRDARWAAFAGCMIRSSVSIRVHEQRTGRPADRERPASDVGKLLAAFATDHYLDADAVREAVRTSRMFNMMHLASGIKVDMILKKATAYRDLEFSRRQPVKLGHVSTWLVSREDLILSKLAWSRDSGSELQLRDARALLTDTVDRDYLLRWAADLGVSDLLERLKS